MPATHVRPARPVTPAAASVLVLTVLLALRPGSSEAQEEAESRAEAARPQAAAPALAGEVSYTLRPPVSVGGMPGAEVGVSAVQVAASVRIQVGPRTFLTPGVSYQGQFLSYQGMESPGASDLHTLEAPVTLLHVIGPKWSLLGRASAGLSGDFESFDRHLTASAAAVAVRVVRPDLTVGFGAMVNHAGGRWLPLPVVTAGWQASDRLRVDAILPSFVKATCRLGDRWEVGALVQGDGTRWALGGGAGQATSIDYYSLDAGAVLGMRIAGNTWFNLFSGWNPLRRYTVHGGPADGHHDPDAAVVLRGGLEVRLPGP